MTADPYTTVSLRATPQDRPIPGAGQTRNAAGGYGWAVNDWAAVDRFLTLGTWSGTYYVTQDDLTLDHAERLLRLAADPDSGMQLVDRIVAVSEAGRAPSNDPALFALAICAAAVTPVRACALGQLPLVARTSTHLFKFLNYVQQMRGWGRALRRAAARWYDTKQPEAIAYQAVKYRSRYGWSHRDVLRKSHPTGHAGKGCDGLCEERRAIYGWITSNTPSGSAIIAAYETIQATSNPDVAARLIVQYGLPWETVPDRLLNTQTVWRALLERIGQTALLRQLPRLTRIGLIGPAGAGETARIAEMLSDPGRYQAGRVHPIAALQAARTYERGESDRGLSQWIPVGQIVGALQDGFHAAFGTVEPAGKRILIGLDVSDSMDWTQCLGASSLTPRDGSVAMSLVTAATEPHVAVVAFSGPGQLTYLPWSGRESLTDAISYASRLPFGATDVAGPMLWAAANRHPFDAFVVYTDNETWAGPVHPVQALSQYRQTLVADAKMVTVALTSGGTTVADPGDSGMLDVVGLDASTPQVISDFLAGRR